ncbi:uncharacterized protein B0I36DRAFT_368765 [Microdochium trichocladiopsis]|uniref:Uncharacterized protein n=1 Tax=Microdochium trichocladiopsis TaxID=1682393 RepID=A0A9P8XSX3_9PEZI|nr:uncharacterized protein B0I36DRAFT_368765 [Microdochium trichocladiopsis]KAH7016155.1 hypothetical protein B0I36DRAFT_368765 [Microdochium trichocladiopsis]
MPYHIEQIIKLKGGNEYKEGRYIRPEAQVCNGEIFDGWVDQMDGDDEASGLTINELVSLLSHRQRS